jgi:hypothetical protein
MVLDSKKQSLEQLSFPSDAILEIRDQIMKKVDWLKENKKHKDWQKVKSEVIEMVKHYGLKEWLARQDIEFKLSMEIYNG